MSENTTNGQRAMPAVPANNLFRQLARVVIEINRPALEALKDK
jgi:hypothetical protein